LKTAKWAKRRQINIKEIRQAQKPKINFLFGGFEIDTNWGRMVKYSPPQRTKKKSLRA